MKGAFQEKVFVIEDTIIVQTLLVLILQIALLIRMNRRDLREGATSTFPPDHMLKVLRKFKYLTKLKHQQITN